MFALSQRLRVISVSRQCVRSLSIPGLHQVCRQQQAKDRNRYAGGCFQRHRYEKHFYGTSSKTAIRTSISEDRKNAIVTWENNKQSKFYSLWLRFNCRCEKCVDKDTNMQQWPVEDIPMNLTIKDFSISENGLVTVTWYEEDHTGIFTTEFLKEYCYSDWNTRQVREQIKPTFHTDADIPSVSWTDVETSDQALYKWLKRINEKGLCLLTDVPVEKGYIKKVLEKMGGITRTMYGEIFDVITMETAINRAYQDVALHFHMDLPFYEIQPGLQLFHCLKFDESMTGGRTTFIDLFHVMEEYRMEYPEEFRILCKVPATFWRIHAHRDNPVHMVHRKHMVTLNDNDEIIGVAYHPHVMGPPLATEDTVEQFYKAYQLLSRKIQSFPYVKKIRYNPGDLICVNNRRFAHGREAFDSNQGSRHLQGAYANVDDFKSKLEVLSRKYDGGRLVQRVGNNDRV